MPGEYGRNVIGSTGIPAFVAASGDAEYLPIGVSIDWNTVAALGSTLVTSPEGATIQAGQKMMQLGQVITRVTNTPTLTLTLTNVTGGTFNLLGYRLDTGAYVIVGPLAYNISAANLAAALNAYTAFGATPLSSVALAAGPPVVYTITTPNVGLTVDPTLLTGSSPTAVIANTTTIGTGYATFGQNYGMWGPYDPAATDGRQTLARSQVAILNSLLIQNGIMGNITFIPSNHPAALVGGTVWKKHLLANASAASLAAGPLYSALETAMPRLSYAGIY